MITTEATGPDLADLADRCQAMPLSEQLLEQCAPAAPDAGEIHDG